jgi:hypothetical protein
VLTVEAIEAALKWARRRGRAVKAQAIAEALRDEYLGQPAVMASACAATVRAPVAILTVLKEQVATMQKQLEANLSKHPDA